MKFKIFKLKRVTSTNDVAMKLIQKEKKEIGFVYAETQTKGRGSQGKLWVSKKGNFFGTIFFQLKKNYPTFDEFSIINPVIISNVIENYCKGKKISFKWPNDIFVNEKKICGILQEVITVENKNFLIIGIGINVLSNPKIDTKYKTTSILKESNKKPQIELLVKKMALSYESFFINLALYDFINFKKKAESMALN